MDDQFSKEPAVLGRDLKDLEKYKSEGTAYLGKVVMSSGERPVLGRDVLVDVSRPHLMLICGKRGGGKCVVGDTKILLEDGSLVKIEDLKKEDRKIISLNDEFKLNSSNKDEFFERYVDKILVVKTATGREIKLTPEHPLLTVGGWKPVLELKKGSRIAVPRTLPFFENEFMSEAQVKLLAYLIAEGHTMNKLVWFTNFDEKIQKDFFESVELFDSALTTKQMKNQGGQFRVTNKIGRGAKTHSLKDWLISIDAYGYKAIEKTIPKKVFQLNKQKTSLFLNSLPRGVFIIYASTFICFSPF